MISDAVEILNAHRIMTISTLRPDGWPQTTIVGYANDGLDIYFLVFRSSQKFLNIQNDDRVSIAVGAEPKNLDEAKAVFAGARASEVTDSVQRAHAWGLLNQRHPNLYDFELPASLETGLMRATCHYLSLLDYSKGFGHTEALAIGDDNPPTKPALRTEDWGMAAARSKSDEARRVGSRSRPKPK